MNRRDFLTGAAAGLGAACISPNLSSALDVPTSPKPLAHDRVTLGKTGIVTSRLAMGTGTIGYAGASNQTRMGALTALLLKGYDHGLNLFDTADSYGSHPEVAAALRQIPRDKAVVLTKCDSRNPAEAKADLDRFLKELGTDYIDILLIHCVTEEDWTTRYRGVMDVFSEAKAQGKIRAHGVSCHSISALRAAAASPWVEVDLVRLNPIGAAMDDHADTVTGVVRQMRAQGKGIIGMKILGQGAMRQRQDEAIRYALRRDVLDAFTIGAENEQEQQDLIHRIAAA